MIKSPPKTIEDIFDHINALGAAMGYAFKGGEFVADKPKVVKIEKVERSTEKGVYVRTTGSVYLPQAFYRGVNEMRLNEVRDISSIVSTAGMSLRDVKDRIGTWSSRQRGLHGSTKWFRVTQDGGKTLLERYK